MLKKAVALSLAISCVFPLIIMLFLSPSIDRIMINESTDEAYRLGEYFRVTERLGMLPLREQVTANDFQQHASEIRQQFNLYKLRVFAEDGEIVYSSAPGEVGTRNEKPYFRNTVALGNRYSQYKETNTASLDGALLTANVIEAYLPIMNGGRFIGAAEVYYDITDVQKSFRNLKILFSLILFGISSVTLTAVMVIFAKARECREQRLHTQDVLIHEQLKSEAVFSAMGDVITVCDPDRRVLYQNSVSRDLHGDRVGQQCYRINEGRENACSDCPLELVFADGHVHRSERSVTTAEGTTHTEVIAAPMKDPSGTIVAAVEVIRDITARRSSEERIQNQLDRLRALRTIDHSISSSLDLRVTLDIFINQVISQLHVDAASVMLYSPETQFISHAASKGFLTDRIRNVSIPAGKSYAGSVILQRKSVLIPDLGNMEDEPLFQGQYKFSEGFLVREEKFRAYAGIPLTAKGHVNGVLEVFHRSPLTPDTEWIDFLEALAGQAAIAIDNATLFEELQKSRDELMVAYDSTIEGWSRALDHRDRETEGHSRRVTELTMRLARAMGIGDGELVHIRRGALLHDIGKLGVPDDVLFKPGRLDEHDWILMRRHPEIAHEILSPISFLQGAIDIPYCHHEKWDGTGYPRGLRGEEIPLPARIFAVIDLWDALSSDRPYRKAWPREKVITHISELSGSHLDPRVVEAFMNMELPPQVKSYPATPS